MPTSGDKYTVSIAAGESPQATGEYAVAGTYNGFPYYSNGTCVLFVQVQTLMGMTMPAAWVIASQLAPDASSGYFLYAGGYMGDNPAHSSPYPYCVDPLRQSAVVAEEVTPPADSIYPRVVWF